MRSQTGQGKFQPIGPHLNSQRAFVPYYASPTNLIGPNLLRPLIPIHRTSLAFRCSAHIVFYRKKGKSGSFHCRYYSYSTCPLVLNSHLPRQSQEPRIAIVILLLLAFIVRIEASFPPCPSSLDTCANIDNSEPWLIVFLLVFANTLLLAFTGRESLTRS